MKKLLLLVITISAFVCTLRAQQPPGDAWNRFQAERKSESTAGILEAIVPLVGHAYAGDIERGLVPLAVSAGGFVLMVVGAGEPALGTIGLMSYIGGRIWGVVSAIQTAEDYNENLRQRLNLSLDPVQGGVGLTLRYNF